MQAVLDKFCAEYFPPPAPRKRTPSPSTNGHGDRAKLLERARKYVAMMPAAISGSGGHDQTFAVACALILGFGLSIEEAWSIIQEYNDRCEPEWSDDELRHKLESADQQTGERGYLRDAQRNGHAGSNGQSKSDSSTSKPETVERPTIIVGTDEYRVNDELEQALCGDQSIFQSDGTLVHVVRSGGEIGGIRRGENSPRISAIALAVVRELAAKNARFVKQVKTPDGDIIETPAHPPEWSVKAIHARGNYRNVRSLDAIVEYPPVRTDGTIVTTAGYDPATRLIYEPNHGPLNIPEKPTRSDALTALSMLLDLVQDFPFAKPAHKSVWVAALLTALGRRAFEGPAPLFLFDANCPGSGKTLLAEIINLILTGREIARMANPRDDEEFRKRITAIAISGDPIILIDNVDGMLGCASLDAVLTGTIWKDRMLGESKIVTRPIRTIWFASGNNVVLRSDTARRVAHCRLNSTTENPEDREDFKYADIRSHVVEHRAELLSAALTLLRAWFMGGRQ